MLTANGTGADPTYQATGGSTSLSVSVRQTVMSGPSASGAPSFLPATSASLTLTTQNISTSVPLTLTAAQGFGVSGAANLVYQFTTNLAWTLYANTTNYLFVNAATGATFTTIYIPVYQFGGTPSASAGQVTFDYQAMIGYLGNGTSAIVTPLVAVGEGMAGASTITSATAYAYNGYYDSGWTPTIPSAGSVVTKSNNIGVDTLVSQFIVECTTADANTLFAVGDTSANLLVAGGSYYIPLTLPTSRLATTFVYPSGTPALLPKNGASFNNISSLSSYKYKILTRRTW